MAIRPRITGADLSTFGKRLFFARTRAGLSAAEFARRMRVSSTAVWNWEKKSRIPRPETMARMANVLAVSEGFLPTGANPPAEIVAMNRKPPSEQSFVVSLADAISGAKAALATATGMPIDSIKLSIEI